MSTTPDTEQFPLTFLPIPLATGDTTPHPSSDKSTAVRAITMTVHLADSTQIDMPLEHRGTGWWIKDPA